MNLLLLFIQHYNCSKFHNLLRWLIIIKAILFLHEIIISIIFIGTIVKINMKLDIIIKKLVNLMLKFL